MLNQKLQAELDQAQQMIVESYPPLLGSLFAQLRVQDFTEEQAFTLVDTYLKATLTNIHSGVA